jgi:FkbM family methyltransferase
MNQYISRTYQYLVPESIRGPIWHFRRFFVSPSRGKMADLCTALGKHTAAVRLGDGVKMLVDLRDRAVGRVLFEKRAYEIAETAFVKSYLRPGMVFVDVGANIGYYTILAGRLVGSQGIVVAVEPEPWNFQILSRNIRRNRLKNVVPVRMAAGRQPCEGMLFKSSTNYGDHRLMANGESRARVKIAVDALDNILRVVGERSIDFLKIDVQGYEAEAFAGMSQTLRSRPPRVILVEYWPFGIRAMGGDPEALLEGLSRLGYRLTMLNHDGTTTDILRSQISEYLPAFNSKHPDSSYVNLILRHSSSCQFDAA